MGYQRVQFFVASDEFRHFDEVNQALRKFADDCGSDVSADASRPTWVITERGFPRKNARRRLQVRAQPGANLGSYRLVLTPSVDLRTSGSLVKSPAFPRSIEVDLDLVINGNAKVKAELLIPHLKRAWDCADASNFTTTSPMIERVVGERMYF
jgi:hypothetical protein